MTKRQLYEPTKDVATQEEHVDADIDVSDDFSQRSSTLPSYEDAVGNTPAPASMESKDEGKIKRRAWWIHKLVWVVAAVVLYNLLATTLSSRLRPAKHTPPSSQPDSDDSSWPSPREIRVHQSFGAIHGTYPLYDLLDLSTTTGAIHVIVEPKPGNKTAVLKVSSKTGAVHVRFIKSAFNHAIRENGEEKGASERTYRTHIETLTGQISAELFHGGAGGETVLEAATGMLDLRITPIGDMESRIQTSTRTGLSKVTVDAPMQGTSLKNLTAVHKSRATGMLDIRYPGEWEGRVHAWSQGTGVVDVKGDGLNFQTVGKDVYAWRGDNASKGGRILDVVSEGTGLVRFRA